MPCAEQITIGSYTEEFLLGQAIEIVQEKTRNSTIFDLDAERELPKFEPSELTIGSVLGRGGFCTVSEIKKVILSDKTDVDRIANYDNDEDDEDDYGGGYCNGQILQDRNFIAAKYLRKGKDARYAIKKLSDNILDDPDRFVAGIIDLAIEARFLAVIKHPNIIKMRAASNTDPYQRGYFIVLDRLYDTLTERITIWKAKKKKMSGFKKLRDFRGSKKKELLVERLLVGYDICAALKYLHSINIIYRDLKPDNIGFDVRGDVKIFDFGLAKEIHYNDRLENELYMLSGNTGSLRYMAPEVAMEEPYNSTVDVYSFGILLWQMCALETPFSGFSVDMHRELVVERGYRPELDPSWTDSLTSLLNRCWSEVIVVRPNFEDVSDALRDEVSKLRGDGGASVLDLSSRTAQSMGI